MSRCKINDRVEVLRSECGNNGRRGIVVGQELVFGIPKWVVSGTFNGHNGSIHHEGWFMDMDLRPLNGRDEPDAISSHVEEKQHG